MTDPAWEKLKRKIEASPKNVTEDKLARLVTGAGFIEHARKKGSHRPFSKKGVRARIGIPRQSTGCVPLVYVRAALRAIEESMSTQEGEPR